MPTRKCEWCGIEYSFERAHSRFHAEKCKVAYWRDQHSGSGPWTFTCVVCGNEFTANRRDSLYDSGACRSKASRAGRK